MRLSRRDFLHKIIFALFSMIFLRHIFKKKAYAAMKETKVLMTPPAPLSPKVVSVHSDSVTTWDYKTYPYVDGIAPDIVNRMISAGIQQLTETRTPSDAWHSLFHSYKQGDIVAIKPNFNDLYKGFSKNLVASPSVLNAILAGLINELKIPPGDITIYDCTRIIPDEFRSRVHFPVRYIEPFGSSFWKKIEYKTLGNPLVKADIHHEIIMKNDIRDKSGKTIKCYLPQVVTKAQHLINVPIFKSHQFVSHSGALKNHYGTVRFSDNHTGPEYLHPPIIDQSIVDINNHEHIRAKTRLIVMDALFGRIAQKGGPPDKWSIFGNNNPNRLFLSQDPVALDSVCHAYIKKEFDSRGKNILSHDYLHLAHNTGIGIHEDPDINGKFKQIHFFESEV